MDQSAGSNQSDDDNPTLWSQQQALELWKYFGGVGAADKNTMVTVESLLLGFSAAIIWYVVTELIAFQPLSIKAPGKGISVALLGLVISIVAGYVSLLYGGYSNWNWAKADAIARDQALHRPKWADLLPENSKAAVNKGVTRDSSLFCAFATRFGRPCDPMTRLPPIFHLYVWLAVGAGLLHGLVLLWSVCELRR